MADPQTFRNIWTNAHELQEGLGFIDELTRLRAELATVRRDFENQKRSVNLVVAAGFLVIIATIFGVGLAALLSLGADSRLIRAAKNLVPDDTTGRVIWLIALLGLAAIVGAAVVGVAGVRRRRRPDRHGVRRTEREAYGYLRVGRGRLLCLGLAGVVAVSGGVVAIAAALHWSAQAIASLGVVVLLLSSAGALWLCWRPITPAKVDEKLAEWYG